VATVETVRGPVEAGMLGRTLAHDHVFIAHQESIANFNHFWGDGWWDEDVRVADAAAKLDAVRAAGIQTIVEPTAYGLGRDIHRIRKVNERVDLNIVVCTGIYAFLELPNFFKYRSDEALANFFVGELLQGIDGTGVKAAFIKCAVEEYGIVGDLPVILAGVASAAVETGAPVMVHTNSAARTGLIALEMLTKAGVEPAKIVIAHAGDSNDLDYLRQLADSGATLGFDRFNIPHFNPDERRIETAVALLAEGYGDRIHFSHDAASFHDFMLGNSFFANEQPSFLHISNVILPALREAGVSEADLDRIMIDNPRRWLTA
jgi:phosphotriesterase-related protein